MATGGRTTGRELLDRTSLPNQHSDVVCRNHTRYARSINETAEEGETVQGKMKPPETAEEGETAQGKSEIVGKHQERWNHRTIQDK